MIPTDQGLVFLIFQGLERPDMQPDSKDMINDVNELIRLEKGDVSRLEHIRVTLEKNKKLYNSDRNYLKKLKESHLSMDIKHTSITEPVKKTITYAEPVSRFWACFFSISIFGLMWTNEKDTQMEHLSSYSI